jgi:3-dehydroquinate synthase
MMKLSNRIHSIDRTPIYFGNDALVKIDPFIRTLQTFHHGMIHRGQDAAVTPAGPEIFILVDPDTRKHCLPLLLQHSNVMAGAKVMEIEGGENSKSIAVAEKLWKELLMAGAGRNSLLVNLGGGVVSDLGGFIAAGYQRGINYINIPTTLIGQADAAIGGKTGVNLAHVKNQVGFFFAPKAVFIFPGFLNTLQEEQLRSGLAEIIKSALISDAALWRKILRHPVAELLKMPIDCGLWINLIASTIKFKNKVVMHDYRERKLRKVLNFGHTIGHALEGYSQSGHIEPLLHGDAMAAGMICAAWLSHRKAGLSSEDLKVIRTYIGEGFPPFPAGQLSSPEIMEIMMHDKKNRNGQIKFTLISKPGHPLINISCDHEEIFEALNTLTGW